MNYKETIQYLYDSVPMFQRIGGAAYKAGLENTYKLDEHFSHPHRQFKTIHVAGTNGKGSCSHTLAAILQSAGYKVGLYTSPHLVDFRERIRVNGECISKEDVVRFVSEERGFFEPLHPSFFELTTALAFKHFAGQKVDVAVIEVGLGGRLDCTNIITPQLSVITNISLDHTQFLGDTLAKIAAEKAGIIKKGVPVVIGETVSETRPVFMKNAAAANAPITFAEDNRLITHNSPTPYGGMDYEAQGYGTLHGELGGDYQVKNANTVLHAVNVLRDTGVFKIDNDAVRTGFSNVVEITGLLGRWQRLQENPVVVCDTGHNAGGWQYLSRQLKRQQCRRLRVVFGMVDDKDIRTVMAMLPKDAEYYFTKADTKRAVNERDVMRIAADAGLQGRCFADVPSAYRQALQEADADDFVFVGGSSYIVADLLTLLETTADTIKNS